MALALLAVLGALAGRMLVRGQRHATGQAERAGVQTSLRASIVVLLTELREIGRDSVNGSDLRAIASDSMTYRAARGLGFTCAVSPNEVRLVSASFTGLRALAAGRDSLFLFVDGDPDRADDDRWAALPVSRTGSGTCGTAPAIVVETALMGLDPARVVVGGPVRSFEVMQVKRYAQGGQHWLGLRSVTSGESIQPLIGPLAPDGLRLRYLDGMGAETGDPSRVRLVEIAVEAISGRAVAPLGGGTPVPIRDTLRAAVALRNSLGAP